MVTLNSIMLLLAKGQPPGIVLHCKHHRFPKNEVIFQPLFPLTDPTPALACVGLRLAAVVMCGELPSLHPLISLVLHNALTNYSLNAVADLL